MFLTVDCGATFFSHNFDTQVNIDISLKNDNPPKRTQEQVFHIAYQAEKILSNIYLRYEDADTDTDPSKISISRKEIPNAMLVRLVPAFGYSAHPHNFSACRRTSTDSLTH